jgi:hypothetical protein
MESPGVVGSPGAVASRHKNQRGFNALGRIGGLQTNSQYRSVILIVHCNSVMLQCSIRS